MYSLLFGGTKLLKINGFYQKFLVIWEQISRKRRPQNKTP